MEHTTMSTKKGTIKKGTSCVLKPGYKYLKGGRVVKAKNSGCGCTKKK